MKTTKVGKLISLLLAILMVVGTVPMQVFAATGESTEQWYVPKGSDSKSRYQDLRKELERVTTDKKYIRLENDIDFSYDCKGKEDWVSGIKVKGDVTFDLNGHSLEASLYKGTADSMEAVNVSMFVIEKGNSLTVRDKKNSGKIATDGYIVAAGTLGKNKTGVNVFNIFEVNGGTLTVNAAGAEFECGRSKKQWVTSSQDGASNGTYTGNIRGQSCGSVIKASANANITIVSGAFMARGYEKISTNRFEDRCAVIKVTDDSSVNIKIYDGTFYGKGCADALQLNDKTNIKVLSGLFDVYKVDRVAISAFKGSVRQCDSRYAVGSYGKIGLPDNAYDKTLADVIVGGHNYSGDETESSNVADDTTKCTEIKPKSNTKTADKAVSVKSKTGVNAWNCAKDASFIIECESSKLTFGRSGYDVLFDALIGKSSFVGKYYLTLCDAETLKPIEGLNTLESGLPEQGGKVEFNIADFKNKNDTKYDFVNSKISEFAVKCEVEEIWNGEHKYTSTYFNYYNFSLTQQDLSDLEGELDFSVVANNVNPAKGFNTQYSIYQPEENMETLTEAGLDFVIDYSYKITNLINGKPVESPELLIAKDKELDDDVSFQSAGWGVITVICDYKFQKPSGEGYDVMRVEKQVFAMPSPRVSIVDDKGNIVKEEFAYKSWFDLEDGQETVIKAGISVADIEKYNFTDKNGKKLSLSDIKWEICTESDDNDKDIWKDYTNVTNGEIKTDQSGKYRAKITYNGVTYYSPFEVLVKGKFYGSNQQAVLTGPANDEKKFGDSNKIEIETNKDAYWSTNGYSITNYRLQLVKSPDGAGSTINSPYIDNGTNSTFDPDNFFRSTVKEADIVPGEYVFIGTVEGTKPNGTYKVKTAEYTLIYTKDPTDITVTVNGETVYEPGKTKTPYFFPWDRTTVRFSSSVWPADATPTSWAKNVPVWSSSDTSTLQIDPGTGVATIKKPGKVTVKVEYRGADKTKSQSIEVYIPIIGYEMELTDFSKFVGNKYSEVTGTIRSVWCLGGEKITTDTDKYLKAEVDGYKEDFSYDTSVDFGNRTVGYDDTGYVRWKISPVGDNILPLNKTKTSSTSSCDEIWYDVATYRIECNGVGNYDSMNYVKAYGGTKGTTDANPYIHRIYNDQDKFEEINKKHMYFCLEGEVSEIIKPGVEYIDTINITVNEPTVGDPRYESSIYQYGTGRYYPEYMIMNIAGTAAKLKDNADSYSLISKITNLTGSGEPYTNASAESSLTEYMNVWNNPSSNLLKPTKKYENGTYVNEVKLEFNGSLDGKEYRIARNAKVYINGHLIDFATVNYSNGDSTVLFNYYFSVGEVETVNEVTLSGFAQNVKQGDMPIGTDDLKVSVAGKERDDIYISSFVWYDDVNSDGKYDASVDKECKSSSYTTPYTAGSVQFAPDGSFLAGKSYKLHLEIASDGKVKFGENFKIKIAENLNDGNKSEYSDKKIDLTFKTQNFVYSFNAETVDSLKTAGDKFKYQPKNEQFGFSCTGKSVINKKNENVIDSALSNGEYVYRAVYTAANGFYFDNACVTGFKVNGKSITKGSYKLENGSTVQTGVTVSSDRKTLTVVYPFTVTGVAETTATVSGTITSSGNAADKISVQLIKNGETKAAYETTVAGNSAKFTFTKVKFGTYTLRVTKNNHITFEQKITVNNANVTQNVKLNHVCDKNKDGKVTEHTYGEWIYTKGSRKVTRECSVCHEKETRLIPLLGDSNGDGVLAAADARITLRASVGLEPVNNALMETSDIDRDGKITAADARSILRASVSLEKLCND